LRGRIAATIPAAARQLGAVMNSFFEHHKLALSLFRPHPAQWVDSIQPFQQPERVVGFFNTYRQIYPVTRFTLREIANQFQRWVSERAAKRDIPIVEAPKGRRDEFVDPYFRRAKPGCPSNLRPGFGQAARARRHDVENGRLRTAGIGGLSSPLRKASLRFEPSLIHQNIP
jgi:hypothetical protein